MPTAMTMTIVFVMPMIQGKSENRKCLTSAAFDNPQAFE
jgi:hypothetical protein